MHWFSHNCIMDVVTWPTATPATPTMLKVFSQTYTARKALRTAPARTAPEKMPHFVIFVPGDLDLWPPNSNSGVIFV